MTLSPEERLRYSRHLALPEIGAGGQRQLRAARVLVIGAGGLGCPAALYLAAAGVGRIGVLDFDRVDASNLQRQVLYDSADIGAPKAERARARLLALNPHIEVTAHVLELHAANVAEVLGPYDIVVDGSDRIGTRYLVNDACVLYRKSLVAAAIHRFEGQAMTFVPGRAPCYRCLFPDMAGAPVANCAEAGVLGVLPGVIGAIQATEVIKLASNVGQPLLGRLLTYDALELRFHELRFARRADCAVCGEHPSIRVPQDPPGFCTLEQLEGVRSLPAGQLAQRLRSGSTPLRLIDVREPAEFVLGHLPQALNWPLATLEQHRAEFAGGGALVFVCRSGVRSRQACALAARLGATDAWQLEGGLLAWQSQVDPAIKV